jgi:hypothetical protein
MVGLTSERVYEERSEACAVVSCGSATQSAISGSPVCRDRKKKIWFQLDCLPQTHTSSRAANRLHSEFYMVHCAEDHVSEDRPCLFNKLVG